MFRGGFGKDQVSGFVAGSGASDVLDFSALGITLADLSITSFSGGTGTRISLIGTSHTVTLSGVAFGTLDEAGDLSF